VEPYSVVEVKDRGRGGTTRGRGRREVRAGAVRGENEVRVNGGQRERGTSSRRNGPQEQNRWNMMRYEASGTVFCSGFQRFCLNFAIFLKHLNLRAEYISRYLELDDKQGI